MNAANTKVMFISAKKTLITDGIMKKIQGAAMNPFYSSALGAAAKKKRILIVDDDANYRNLARE